MIASKLIVLALMGALALQVALVRGNVVEEVVKADKAALGIGALGATALGAGIAGASAKAEKQAHEHHHEHHEHHHNPLLGGGPLDGLFGGVKKLFGGEHSHVYPTKSQDKTEVKPAVNSLPEKEIGFLGVKTAAELLKLALNPIEFLTRVARHFKLSFEKFLPAVTKGVNVGLEVAVQPLLLTLKLVEKVFKPDHCRLKFICSISHNVAFAKSFIPQLSDKVLGESSIFKALSDGIHKGQCETLFPCHGGLKLKDEYKQHQHGHHENHHEGNHQHGGENHHQHGHENHQHGHENHQHGGDNHQHGGEGHQHQHAGEESYLESQQQPQIVEGNLFGKSGKQH